MESVHKLEQHGVTRKDIMREIAGDAIEPWSAEVFAENQQILPAHNTQAHHVFWHARLRDQMQIKNRAMAITRHTSA